MKLLYFSLASIIILLIFGCCPKLVTPKITVSANQVDQGKTLILGLKTINHAEVYWTGPDGTFIGNPWIRENTTPAMSGSYTAKYVCRLWKKKQSATSSAQITINTCPKLPTPTIYVNNHNVEVGQTIILTAPSIPNTTINWIGPDGSFTGNPWIRTGATQKMSGDYIAYYVYPGIPNCESAKISTTIQVYDPSVPNQSKISYKGKDYKMLLRWDGNVGKVVLAPLDADVNTANAVHGSTSGDEIVLMYLTVRSVLNVDDWKKSFAKTITYIQNGKTYTGCFGLAGAVGCSMAIAETGGAAAAIPECDILIAYADKSLEACVLGAMGDIAGQAGYEGPAVAADLAVDIKGGDFFDMALNAIKGAILVSDSQTPEFQNGQMIPTPPAAPVQPKPPVQQPKPPVQQPKPPIQPLPPPEPICDCEDGCWCVNGFCYCDQGPIICDYCDAIVFQEKGADMQSLKSHNELNATLNDLTIGKNFGSPFKTRITTSDKKIIFRFAKKILVKKFGKDEVMVQIPFTVSKVNGSWLIIGSNDVKPISMIIDPQGTIIYMNK